MLGRSRFKNDTDFRAAQLMVSYLLVISLLVLLAFWENGGSAGKTPGTVACAVLMLFGGLRFETGFDWVEYENYFELTTSIWADQPQYVAPSLLVEPGFAIFVKIVRSLGIGFQWFLFLITAINMGVIYIFARRYTERVALVLLIYFGFAFLAGQMAAIRQTLSYSFILLAFMERERGKLAVSVVLALIAASIHTFSIVLLPLIYLKVRHLPVSLVSIIAALGIATAYSGFHIIPLFADVLLPQLGSGFLATKLSLYGDYEGYAISVVSLLFVPFHIFMYHLLITNRYSEVEKPSAIIEFAIIATLLSVLAHSYFGVFPAFWNRLSYMTFLLQAVALTAKYRQYLLNSLLSVPTIMSAGSAAVAVTLFTLSAPTSLPYLPYQNAIGVWISDDLGDGRWRYAYALAQAEREIASRRR